MVITRYAPTPSGYLHLGNAANFALTAQLARDSGGTIALRIDDADTARTRREYLTDIFDVLAWLELPWDIGPRSVEEMTQWSQSTRRPLYEAARDRLRDAGAVYACECPRRAWIGYRGDECPGLCRGRGVRFTPGSNSLRFDRSGRRGVVLWRSDDTPAYHLASVVDDDEWGVDVVVRGEDLRESTDVQREISRLLPGSTFHRAEVIHHLLVIGPDDRKLSKSAGAGAAPMPRTPDMRSEVDRSVKQIRAATPRLRLRNPGS